MFFSVHLVICCRSRFFDYGTEHSILLIIWPWLYMIRYSVPSSTISWSITISDLMVYFTLDFTVRHLNFNATADHQVILILNVHFWACSYYPLYFIHFKLLAPNFRYGHHAVWCWDWMSGIQDSLQMWAAAQIVNKHLWYLIRDGPQPERLGVEANHSRT
jgi:hypothetical protein